MALTVNYKLSPDTSVATLYRAIGAKIDIYNLPTDKVVLNKLKTEHVYTDGTDGVHYSFIVESVDSNGRKNYSSIQDVIYKNELGPGPSRITRGYFDFGVYGEVSDEELGISIQGVRDYLSLTFPKIPLFEIVGTGWYKCLVDGKVIFIPKGAWLLGGYTSYYTATTYNSWGLVDSKFGFDECLTIFLGGNEYKIRSIAHHDTRLTGAEALAAMKNTVVSSKHRREIGMYACLSSASGGSAGTAPEDFGYPPTSNPSSAYFRGGVANSEHRDYVNIAVGTSAWPGAGAIVYSTNNPTPGVGVAGDTYNARFIYVLELLD